MNNIILTHADDGGQDGDGDDLAHAAAVDQRPEEGLMLTLRTVSHRVREDGRSGKKEERSSRGPAERRKDAALCECISAINS